MDLTTWKKAKKDQHLNYEDIAQLSGVPLTTVKNIFCGYTATPRIDTVQAIEHALGLDVNTSSSIQIPEKYGNIFVALNNGDENLEQSDVDDIVRFIEFKKTTKKK